MQKSCEHGLTEILDTGEGVDVSGAALVVRVEACRLCGQRRAVTKRNGEDLEGSWDPYRFNVSPGPHLR